MSTIYTTNIQYDEFIKNQNLGIQEPIKSGYSVPHKMIHFNGTYLYVFKDKDNTATIERYGVNDVSKIFPNIIKEFPEIIIYDSDYGLPWTWHLEKE